MASAQARELVAAERDSAARPASRGNGLSKTAIEKKSRDVVT